MRNKVLLDRIGARLEALGISERKASLAATGKVDAIRTIRRGAEPTVTKLRALAQVLKVPEQYLIEVTEGAIEPDLPSSFDTNGESPYLDAPSILPPGYVSITTLDTRLSMGEGAFAESDHYGPPQLLPERLIRGDLRGTPDDFLLVELDGPSMEPVFLSRDWALIDKRKTNPSQPGSFALWDGYGLVVKWVQRVPLSDPPRLKISSENPRFDPYETLADDARIIGRVVWIARQV